MTSSLTWSDYPQREQRQRRIICTGRRHSCSRPRRPYYQFQSRMHAGQSLVIHEVLPPEVLGVIFEEHAKLEWEAPTTDGLVCRFWREITLNTPRVWAYVNFNGSNQPSTKTLHLRLHRSGTAPLYVDMRHEGPIFIEHRVCDPSWHYHTRIASLRLTYGDENYFDKRDFPCLRVLDIENWSCMLPIECLNFIL